MVPDTSGRQNTGPSPPVFPVLLDNKSDYPTACVGAMYFDRALVSRLFICQDWLPW